MHTPRFFCPQLPAPGELLILAPAAAHHAARVLRLGEGAAVAVFDGSGAEYPARIVRLGREQCQLELGPVRHPDVESPLAITLGQGLTLTDKFDLVLQKAVELGVAMISPLALRRSIVRLDAERAARRQQHWQGVVIAACEQCGRVRIPPIGPVQGLPAWLAALPAGQLRLRLAPEAQFAIADLPPPVSGITLAVGPEGGFDPAETAELAAAGFVSVRLGPRVLRTETAALAAIAALQSWHGDFRPHTPGFRASAPIIAP